MNSEKYNIELSANALKMRGELDKANKKLRQMETGFDKGDKAQSRFNVGSEKLASTVKLVGAALVTATVALTAYAVVQGRATRETEALANMAGLTVNEFKEISFVMGTVGISAEKFGDIMKDTQEKVGDFLATGGGAFQDFADVMGLTKSQANTLAKEFETMSGDQVLQAMVTQMQNAGKSSQQMSFALEGMASDTTRLIPLLKDSGKAAEELKSQFSDVNIDLSAEEREQFAKLAENVDLATIAFKNLLNEAIVPLLPQVNSLITQLSLYLKSSAVKTQLFSLYNDTAKVKDLENIEEVDLLLLAVNKDMEETAKTISGGVGADRLARLTRAQIDALDIKEQLETQKELLKSFKEIEDANPAAEITESVKGKNSSKSGAESIADGEGLEKTLEKLQDAKKTKLQLLQEEQDERLAINEQFNTKDGELTQKGLDFKRQIEQDFKRQIFEDTQTEADAKQQAYADELASLKEFYDNKLISEEEYQAKLNEIIAEFAPSTLNPELLEEENQRELEALQSKLDNKLILHREYFEQLAMLEKKDLKDKGEKTKTEDFWSKSSVKTQIGDGIALLNAVGTNSKKAHKIKQGLAVANAGMNTAEGITKALANQNYVAAALTAATGAAQIAAILSSSPDGGGSSISAPQASQPQPEPEQSIDVQDTTITDISGGGQESTVMRLEFTDEVVDVLAYKIKQSNDDGRS